MRLQIYNVLIHLYAIGVKLAGWINAKARSRDQDDKLLTQAWMQRVGTHSYTWVHCASIGEYHQIKPVIDHLKARGFSEHWVISFFSPSGMEQFVDQADFLHASYLPFDRFRAMNELASTNIKCFLVTKSEIWPILWDSLSRKNIDIFLVAAAFGPQSLKSSLISQTLKKAKLILSQDKQSLDMMKKASLRPDQYSFGGNPRIDRVIDIRKEPFVSRKIEQWKGDAPLMIVGSSWIPDMRLIAEYLQGYSELEDYKVCIAPHDIGSINVDRHAELLDEKQLVIWSRSSKLDSAARFMILDTVGILAKAYRYADIVYIGGGFKTGLHNILEPAVYQLPVIFGPKYDRFPEARDLIRLGCAHSISSVTTLHHAAEDLLGRHDEVKKALEEYFGQHSGSSERIADIIIANAK